MIQDRLATYFTKDKCPDWICPACGNRTLTIKKGSFNYGTSSKSLNIYKQDYGDLSDIELIFSCLLECEFSRCKDIISMGGRGCVEEIPYDDDSSVIEYFQAEFFIPPLKVFTVPERCPLSISKPLDISFSLFLSSPSAAANIIRITVEALMDALDIDSKGKLHNRIEKLPEKYSEHKDALMAIKWLGNSGSHKVDEVKIQDIEIAYEILDFVLGKIYGGRTEHISSLIKRLDENFNPQNEQDKIKS